VDSLEGVGGSSCLPHGGEALSRRTARPVAIDLGLLLGVAGKALDCFVGAHTTIVVRLLLVWSQRLGAHKELLLPPGGQRFWAIPLGTVELEKRAETDRSRDQAGRAERDYSRYVAVGIVNERCEECQINQGACDSSYDKHRLKK
jgi:hypothetical protein